MKLTLPNLTSGIVTLLTPIVLIGMAIRVLLTPLFYTIEYNLPYFPMDDYGFTKEERLKWAGYSVEYLVNNSDISYLGVLRFDDGDPLFNARELSHMKDVKDLIQRVLLIWTISITTLLILGILAWRSGMRVEFIRGLMRGGWLMLILAVSLGLIAGIGITLNADVFWGFFTLFHQVFFSGDSWLFYYSDTLIRLFPIRFWQDAVLAIAMITIGGGMGLAFGLRKAAA